MNRTLFAVLGLAGLLLVLIGAGGFSTAGGKTLSELPLGQAFQLPITISHTTPFRVTLPANGGIVISRLHLNPITGGRVVLVRVNGLLVYKAERNSSGESTFNANPPIIVPPLATLEMSTTGNPIDVYVGGYVVSRSDLGLP